MSIHLYRLPIIEPLSIEGDNIDGPQMSWTMVVLRDRELDPRAFAQNHASIRIPKITQTHCVSVWPALHDSVRVAEVKDRTAPSLADLFVRHRSSLPLMRAKWGGGEQG
jgi:hypothetical protein